MTIVTNMVKSVLNFVVLNSLIAVGTTNDPKFYIGSFLAIVMGFLLRVGIEWNNSTLTWKRSLIQAIFSMCLCYLSILVWLDYSPHIRLEYYLFFCSLFSVFIVGLLEKVFKMGLAGYARLLIQRVIAEDSKPKEDNL